MFSLSLGLWGCILDISFPIVFDHEIVISKAVFDESWSWHGNTLTSGVLEKEIEGGS